MTTVLSALMVVSALSAAPAQAAMPAFFVPKIEVPRDAFLHAFGGRSELRVLSYNVKALPWPLAGGHRKRLRLIGLELAKLRAAGTAPHVVVVQEGFLDGSRLQEFSGYPYAVKGPNHGARPMNSGLWILSEYPIVDLRDEMFKKCVGPDCLASKAVLLVSVRVPFVPEPVQIATTHLNADSGNDKQEAAKVRGRQIEQFKRFFDGRAKAYATVFAGDFNTKPGRPQWDNLDAALGMRHAGRTCLGASAGCRVGAEVPPGELLEDTVDHHFYTGSDRVGLTPVSFDILFTEKVDGERLSDHEGVLVGYDLTW